MDSNSDPILSDLNPEDTAAVEAEAQFEAQMKEMEREARHIAEEALHAIDQGRVQDILERIKNTE